MTEHSTAPEGEAPDVLLCHRWRQGDSPDVAAFLAGFPNLEPAEMAAVLLVDQRERWLLGERITAEAYLERFPALAADSEAVVELAYGEFLLREEQGEAQSLRSTSGASPPRRSACASGLNCTSPFRLPARGRLRIRACRPLRG
jgi:hypothetical protein